MTKKDLFKKYSINESHNVWDNVIDNWMSVEVYRIMHNGKLPSEGDSSVGYILKFLDKCHDDPEWFSRQEQRGFLYLTSKRMVYSLSEEILHEINS